ncbi:MAG: hypothetical protein ABWZ53_01290 [Actinomycetota bacterium]
MNIGQPKRIIEIEPATLPLPGELEPAAAPVPLPEEPAVEPEPVAPSDG